MIESYNYDALIDAFNKIENKQDMKTFLLSLCTKSELDKMMQRLYIAKLFVENESYKSIVEKTNASTATLAKVKYDLFYGNRGL